MQSETRARVRVERGPPKTGTPSTIHSHVSPQINDHYQTWLELLYAKCLRKAKFKMSTHILYIIYRRKLLIQLASSVSHPLPYLVPQEPASSAAPLIVAELDLLKTLMGMKLQSPEDSFKLKLFSDLEDEDEMRYVCHDGCNDMYTPLPSDLLAFDIILI